MLAPEIRNHLLVDELQLGTTLNGAVHNNDRAYFNLLLSMLSPDVTDSATAQDLVKTQNKEEDLYLRLGILKGRVDYAISDDYSLAAVNGDMVDAGLQASLELSLCLHGEPLALKKQDLPPEVMANLSPLERQKTQCELAGEHLARGAFDLHTLDIVDAIEASRNISALV